MKIAIVGAAGRMGKMIEKLVLETPDASVAARLDIAEGFDRSWPADTDAVIDFSFHTVAAETAAKAAAGGIAYVIGTTGLTEDEQRAVEEAARKIPVVQSGNYSLGVNLLLNLVREAARALGAGYDAEIVEMHHRHKKDAPSGTALMLAKAVAEGRGADFGRVGIFGRHGMTGERTADEIAVHALRGGSVVGDHTVMFAGDVERIELVHRAQSREAFAAGAIRAAQWAKGRAPGLYSMRDVLGLS